MGRFKVALIANDGHEIPEWVWDRFNKEDIDFIYHDCYSAEDLKNTASDADVLFLTSSRKSLVVEENMEIFKKAGCAFKCGSGTDNIDKDACSKRGIIVSHTPETVTEPTSDHFIAMLFTAVRQTARQDRMIRKGIWAANAVLPTGHLTGADLGIIGFGRIGTAIVKKLSGFNMNIRAYDPYKPDKEINKHSAKKVGLDELLRESQYVITSCPLIEKTKDLIGEPQLKMMRRDAVLVNVARAGIVNEEALKKALREKWIEAAALDVLKEHPLKPGNEWLEFENVNFTPHMGGYTEDYPEEVFRMPVEEIIMISKGYMPKWVVNKACRPKWKLKKRK